MQKRTKSGIGDLERAATNAREMWGLVFGLSITVEFVWALFCGCVCVPCLCWAVGV